MIDFYSVDSAYLDYLRQYEKKIPRTRYDTHEKFFCGVLLNIHGCNYFAPVSSFRTPLRTNFAIYDKNNKRVLSTVRLNFMFPALPSVITALKMKELYQKDHKYAVLVDKEYKYCADNEKSLRKRAEAVYKIGCNKDHSLNYTCCDFLKLEGIYRTYTLDKQQTTEIDLLQLPKSFFDVRFEKDMTEYIIFSGLTDKKLYRLDRERLHDRYRDHQFVTGQCLRMNTSINGMTSIDKVLGQEQTDEIDLPEK